MAEIEYIKYNPSAIPIRIKIVLNKAFDISVLFINNFISNLQKKE